MHFEDISYFVREYGALAMFVLMYSNGVLSMPASEAVLAAGGAIIAAHYGSFLPIATAAILGNLSGALTLYSVGRRVGCSWVQTARKRALSLRIPVVLVNVIFPDEMMIDALRYALKHRSAIWIGILRCLPMLRSMVSLPAGMVKMPIVKFVGWSFLGISVWAGLWVGVGFFLQTRWHQVGSVVSGALIVVLCALVVYCGRFVLRRYGGGDSEWV
jgi:membrane protein DedA with SNARE-associated domain